MGIINSSGKFLSASPDIEKGGLPYEMKLRGIDGVHSTLIGLPTNLTRGQSTTQALVDGTVVAVAVYIPFDIDVAGFVYYLSTAASAVTVDNTNHGGIYSSDGTDLTLIASSPAGSAGMWSPTAGPNTLAFTTAPTVTPGVYWLAILPNWSAVTGAPAVYTSVATGNISSQSMGAPADVKRAWTLASQTELPATIAWTAVTGLTKLPTFLPYKT